MGHSNFHKSIIANSPVGYSYNKIIYDENGNPKDYEFIEINKAYEVMVGIEKKDLIGKRFSKIYEDTMKEQNTWKDFHSNIVEDFTMEEFEYNFDFMGNNYRVKIHTSEKDYLTIYLTDISREIEETEKLNMLSDHVPIQVWYLKDSNTYVSANKAHADFRGVKKEYLTSRKIRDLFKEEESKRCIEENEKVFKQKKQIVTKQWINNSQGENRLLRISKNPKFNLKGQVEFVICLAEDITEEHINKEQNKIKERILYSTMEFTQELLTNDNLYHALSNGIAMLGNATQVDRVYYWENHYDEKSERWLSSQRFEWCLGGVTEQIDNPELQNVSFEEAGDFIGVLSKNKTFNSHIKDMDVGSSTKESFQAQGILSILAIPVFVEDEFRGFIGFDSCRFEKEWSEIEISLLNSFVFLYVKAFERNLLEKSVVQSEENLFNFFNMIQDLLFVLDFEGNIVDINNNVLDKMGYSREELLGKPVLKLHPKEQVEEVKKNIEDLIMKKIEFCDIPAVTKDGYVFPVETRVSQGLWNGEQVIFGVSKDISDLRMSEEKFSKAFNNSGISMFISKFEDGEILEVNDRFLDYFGYTRDEIIGKSTLDLNVIAGFDDRETMKKDINAHEKISDMEVEIRSKDNITRIGLVNISPININNEKCLLSSIVDITERVEYERKLLELSNRDPLTGLYNRRCIYERGEEVIEEYKRNGKLFSLAIIDLDNFKNINDEYGHQVGDYVLREFTKAINDNLRIYDILGRYGGEEFIVILNHSNRKESNIVLERILNIVRNKTFICGEDKIKLTFSAGISSCEELEKDEISMDKLVELADKRMYIAKKSGKNGVVYKQNLSIRV